MMSLVWYWSAVRETRKDNNAHRRHSEQRQGSHDKTEDRKDIVDFEVLNCKRGEVGGHRRDNYAADGSDGCPSRRQSSSEFNPSE